MEIEQRLGLYQVFLKLYQYHRNLLDDILQLEKMGDKTLSSRIVRYVTGVCQGKQAYLVTNLVRGRTQTLFQPQGIWTIGRDRQLAISVSDRHLSRHHAVIQYVENQGFYLVDLNSTNGSFVNGEPLQGSVLLQDGDRIRLSTLAFCFFLCQDTHTLDRVPPTILAELQDSIANPKLATPKPIESPISKLNLDILPLVKMAKQEEPTSQFLEELSHLEQPPIQSATPKLSPVQQSEILDRFFKRQVQKPNQDD